MYDILDIGTPLEDPYDPVVSPTMATNATVAQHQQANDTHDETHRISKNAATMDKDLKHQIIYTYLTEIRNK